MKKSLIVFFLFLVSMFSYAQDRVFTAYEESHFHHVWSKWEKSNVRIVLNHDYITISENGQGRRYSIIETQRTYTDNYKAKISTFVCWDMTNSRACDIRLRQERGGRLQFYVDYGNVILAWNVKGRFINIRPSN